MKMFSQLHLFYSKFGGDDNEDLHGLIQNVSKEHVDWIIFGIHILISPVFYGVCFLEELVFYDCTCTFVYIPIMNVNAFINHY